MGTYIDYHFRIEGSNKAKKEQAQQLIREVQKNYAVDSSESDCEMSHEIEEQKDGSLEWHCFWKASENDPAETLRESLIPLTEGGDFHFWFYDECNDGCNESGIQHFEDGKQTYYDGCDNGHVGLYASVAAAKLENAPDVDAALTLLEEAKYLFDGNWDEDFHSELFDARLAADLLVQALHRWPNLLANTFVQAKLCELESDLAVLREGIDEFDPFDDEPEGEGEIPALEAFVEAAVLQQLTAMPTANASGTSAGSSL